MQLPDEITTFNGIVNSISALCLCFKRYAYPCRYGDLVFLFEKSIPEVFIITNHGRWHHLLSRYNHNLLSLKSFSKNTRSIGKNRRKLTSCPAVFRRRQIAFTKVIAFGTAPVSSLMSTRSRHVTKSNGVVQRKSSIRKLPNANCKTTRKIARCLRTRSLIPRDFQRRSC